MVLDYPLPFLPGPFIVSSSLLVLRGGDGVGLPCSAEGERNRDRVIPSMYRGGAVRRVRLRHKADPPVPNSRRKRQWVVDTNNVILMDLSRFTNRAVSPVVRQIVAVPTRCYLVTLVMLGAPRSVIS